MAVIYKRRRSVSFNSNQEVESITEEVNKTVIKDIKNVKTTATQMDPIHSSNMDFNQSSNSQRSHQFESVYMDPDVEL